MVTAPWLSGLLPSRMVGRVARSGARGASTSGRKMIQRTKPGHKVQCVRCSVGVTLYTPDPAHGLPFCLFCAAEVTTHASLSWCASYVTAVRAALDARDKKSGRISEQR